jgi:hypothetical protein
VERNQNLHTAYHSLQSAFTITPSEHNVQTSVRKEQNQAGGILNTLIHTTNPGTEISKSIMQAHILIGVMFTPDT